MSRLTEGAYGFAWGPMNVTRMATMPGGAHVLRVETDAGKHIDIYVSKKGHSVRAFRDGQELK